MTEEQIITIYAARRMTIREIANASGLSYETVRQILVKAGYHNTKH